MRVSTIGLDLAKSIFQVHGVTDQGEVAFNRPLRRARELSKLGHEVRLIPPLYVKPYVKRGKSDAVDAEARLARR